MQVERKILGNTLVLVSGQVIAQVANFGFVILIARFFGASTLGLYSLAMAVGALSGIFVSFGSTALARKEIAREPQKDRELIGRILPLQILAGIAVSSILVVLTSLLSEDRTAATIILVIVLFNVISRWQFLFLSRYQARQSMLVVAAVQAGTRIGILCLGGLAAYMAHDVILTVVGLPLSAMLMLLLLYFSGNRSFGSPILTLRAAEAVATLRAAWPFMSLLLLAVLYERLGIVFLRVFHSDAAVGYFSSAERLLVPFTAVLSAFVAAVFPAIMRISPDERRERHSLASRFLRVLLVLILPAATFVFMYRADIILLVYGAEFEVAISVLTILAWAIALRGFNAFFSMLAISMDLQSRLSLLKLTSLIVFVLLAVVLIPLYSYSGLACSIVAAELFLAVGMWWLLRREYPLASLLDIFWRPVLCCVLTIVATMTVSTFAVVLVAAAFLTGAVRRHDLRFLLRIANDRRAKGLN
jgi:O-antigen/teichoic acid export membrane protein